MGEQGGKGLFLSLTAVSIREEESARRLFPSDSTSQEKVEKRGFLFRFFPRQNRIERGNLDKGGGA